MIDRRVYVLLVVLYVAALILRVDVLIRAQAGETLSHHVGERALVVGVVTADPDVRTSSAHVSLRVETVGDASTTGILLTLLPRGTLLAYGDTIAVRGTIAAPKNFETDTGRSFDYVQYLRVQGISAVMQNAKLTERAPGPWSLQKTLFDIKHVFEASLRKLFPQPNESLLEGILLGERQGLPDELNQAFITSGLVHVVVLSGYNISVVSNAMLYATSFLPRVMSYTLGGTLMLLFALMVGAGATTVRALLMGLISILALYVRRPTAALRSLVAAAAVMVLWNPLIVLYDTSFILSVLATFGLITISPTVERKLLFLPERLGLRTIAASTIAVQLYVLPALLYMSGVLSFLALPANLLVLPIVPAAMLMGFLAGAIGFVHPLLASPFALACDALLTYMIAIANVVQHSPLSSVVLPAFPAWVAVLAYVPLTALAIWLYRQTAARTRSS